MCMCRMRRTPTLFGLPLNGSPTACMAGEYPLRRRDWLAVVATTATALWSLPSLIAAKLYGNVVTYDIVSSKVVKGSQTTVSAADGTFDIHFQFHDRGRGADLRSTIVVDPQGLITSLHTTGHNYYNVPVDERFSFRDGIATWKNAGEDERITGTAPRFYSSMDGSAEEGAIFTRAALNARNATLALWPAGEGSIRKLKTLVVSSGSATRRVTMYEALGFDFTPTPVWLTEDGALFMSGNAWFAVIATGWKSTLPTLFAAQDERVAELGRGFAATLPQRAGTALAITNVTFFDAEAGTMESNATVIMHGDTIAAVGGSDVSVPSDARRIDGTGKTLLPGLWNMHMHLYSPDVGPRLLAEGVTTIRDPGNAPDLIVNAQRQFASGELLGPRIIIAGLIDGTGQYTAPIGTNAATIDQAIAQVHDWNRRGAVQIKIYSSLDPSLVPAIVAEAHKLGMRVSGHIPAGMIAQDAVQAGFDEIQHVNFLFLNFMPDTKDLTQTPVRLTAAAERSGMIDLQSRPVAEFIALLKNKDIVSDPTVAIFYEDCVTRNGDLSTSGFAEIADWLPVQVRRGLLTGGLQPTSPAMDAQYRASGKAFLAMVALLHANGIRIVAGTDDVLPGFDLIRELELYSKAGIPNAAVLQSATIQPARVMRMDGTLGSLRAGKLADAIIVYGNPLDDIAQLRRVGTTIKGGVMYDTRALYATAGVHAPPLVSV